MAVPLSQVFFPSAFQELFSTWSRLPDALLCAGGTGFTRTLEKKPGEASRVIISLDKMEELKKISRTERYLEIGAAVKLSQVINLGKIVPEAITRCLLCIADPQIRNQATIGGNICYPSRRLDASIPLVALDAQYELRTAQSSRWVSAARFSSLAAGELLTRIRVPLEPWTFTWYHKLPDTGAGAILFIMRNEKNILTNIRIVCGGKTVLRDKNSETILLGKRLPLERRNAEAFADRWKSYLSGIESPEENPQAELEKTRIINFIKIVLRDISD